MARQLKICFNVESFYCLFICKQLLLGARWLLDMVCLPIRGYKITNVLYMAAFGYLLPLVVSYSSPPIKCFPPSFLSRRNSLKREALTDLRQRAVDTLDQRRSGTMLAIAGLINGCVKTSRLEEKNLPGLLFLVNGFLCVTSEETRLRWTSLFFKWWEKPCRLQFFGS